jgi:hypothetical protein
MTAALAAYSLYLVFLHLLLASRVLRLVLYPSLPQSGHERPIVPGYDDIHKEGKQKAETYEPDTDGDGDGGHRP